MKKLLVLLLTLALVLSIAACGGNENIRGEQTDNTSADETSSDAEFSLGEVEGLTYENKFIGLGCTLDDSWSFYTDEQIKELNNITADLAGEEFENAVKNAEIVYDMYAANDNQLDSININLEKANPIQIAALDIKENYKSAVEIMKSSYENMGYTSFNYEIGSAKIGDQDFPTLNITAEISGVKMYQVLFSKKCKGYLANVAITTFQENTADDILAKFYIVK